MTSVTRLASTAISTAGSLLTPNISRGTVRGICRLAAAKEPVLLLGVRIAGLRPLSTMTASAARGSVTSSATDFAIAGPRTRSYSTVSIETPVQRLERHFDKDPHELYQVMTQIYLDKLPNDVRSKFVEKYGSPDKAQTKPEQAVYVNELLGVLADLDKAKTSIVTDSRWAHYKIGDIESVAGCSARLSSTSANHVASYLPGLVKHLYPSDYTPSIIEVGGFCHNDAFLFNMAFAKAGFEPSEYIGIDLFHKGIVAANCFNDGVAKKENLTFIHNTADVALSNLRSTHKDKDKILIALRFLSAVEPEVAGSLFHNTTQLLKPEDLFVFNYSLYNEDSLRVGNNPKYELTVDNEVHVLRKEGVVMQTFFTEKQIGELLEKNGFQLLDKKTPAILDSNGDAISRGNQTHILER